MAPLVATDYPVTLGGHAQTQCHTEDAGQIKPEMPLLLVSSDPLEGLED